MAFKGQFERSGQTKSFKNLHSMWNRVKRAFKRNPGRHEQTTRSLFESERWNNVNCLTPWWHHRRFEIRKNQWPYLSIWWKPCRPLWRWIHPCIRSWVFKSIRYWTTISSRFTDLAALNRTMSWVTQRHFFYQSLMRLIANKRSIHFGNGFPWARLRTSTYHPIFLTIGILWVSTNSINVPSGSSM